MVDVKESERDLKGELIEADTTWVPCRLASDNRFFSLIIKCSYVLKSFML